MGQKKVYHVQPLTEGKKNIIAALMDEYDIQNTDDIQEVPSSTALMKPLYLSTLQVTKKWNQPIHGWGSVHNEFCIMYEGRMPE